MLRARTERDRETETETEGALLFVFMHPTQSAKVGGVPKNKTREQQAQARQKKKRRDFTCREEREIYRRDFFKTVSTNQPKNEKAKQDEKYLDALSEARSILPLFLKDQQKANGQSVCDDTL